MANNPTFHSLGFGVGLRAQHYHDILDRPRCTDWLEAITENYLDTRGRPFHILECLRRDYPIALHGVALSIGSADPLNRDYLRRLRLLVDHIRPALVTDHLCWTGVGGRSLYDLLPIPYTEEALWHVVSRVRSVQEHLGCRIALENPSSYVAFRESTLTECEFLAAVAVEADCGILLDINNVYVSGSNLGFDPVSYVDALPVDRVVQFHLAGFTDLGTFLFDTHSAPVREDVWHLYRHAVARFGLVPTLVEWDAELPSFERVCVESHTARRIAEEVNARRSAKPAPNAGVDGVADRAA